MTDAKFIEREREKNSELTPAQEQQFDADMKRLREWPTDEHAAIYKAGLLASARSTREEIARLLEQDAAIFEIDGEWQIARALQVQARTIREGMEG